MLSLLQSPCLSQVRSHRCHPVARTSAPQAPARPYYLVTFTVPAQLRQVIRSHQKDLYPMLLRESAAALREVARDHKDSAPKSDWSPFSKPGRATCAIIPTSTASCPPAASPRIACAGSAPSAKATPAAVRPGTALAHPPQSGLAASSSSVIPPNPPPRLVAQLGGRCSARRHRRTGLKYLAAYVYRTAFSASGFARTRLAALPSPTGTVRAAPRKASAYRPNASCTVSSSTSCHGACSASATSVS